MNLIRNSGRATRGQMIEELEGLTEALASFRAVGLEDTARRAALQLLLLERS